MFSCDTAAAWTKYTVNENTPQEEIVHRFVFGKNSDRHLGEKQFIEQFPSQDFSLLSNNENDNVIQATYGKISINQLFLKDLPDFLERNTKNNKLNQEFFSASRKREEENDNNNTENNDNNDDFLLTEKTVSTSSHFISRPAWMYGSEMSFNEFGVCSGNEAVFSSPKPISDPKLINSKNAITGMDALRISTMFSKNARACCKLLACLIEKDELKNGFRGDCGDGTGKHPPFVYHNGYIICDFQETLVFFQLGKHWCVCKLYDEISSSSSSSSASSTSSSSSWNVFSLSNTLPKDEIKIEKVLAMSEDFLEFANWINTNKKDNNNNDLRSNIFPSSHLWFKILDFFANGNCRQCVVRDCIKNEILKGIELTQKEGEKNEISNVQLFELMAKTMRMHGNSCEDNNDDEKNFCGPPNNEFTSLSQVSVCMHGTGVGPIRENLTTNSLIVVGEFRHRKNKTEKNNNDKKVLFAFSTCAPNPCTSCFTPLIFGIDSKNNNNFITEEKEDSSSSCKTKAAILGELSPRQISFESDLKTSRRWDQVEQTIRLASLVSPPGETVRDLATKLRKIETKYIFSPTQQEKNEKIDDYWNCFSSCSTSDSETRKKQLLEMEQKIDEVLCDFSGKLLLPNQAKKSSFSFSDGLVYNIWKFFNNY